MNLNKIWIFYNVLLFLGLGLYTFIKPYTMSSAMGYQLLNVTAIAELKASYGGMLIAIAVIIFLSYIKLDAQKAIAFIGLLYTGYAFGRGAGVILDHAFDKTTMLFWSIELSSVLISGLLYYFGRK